MKYLRYALLAVALLVPSMAQAANRFWIGGAGTWDSSTTTHWSATTGGAGGASAPTTGDAITFDGNSGTGTVTVDVTVSGKSFASITCGNFVGTIDFSAISALTITGPGGVGISVTGSATRTITLGSATYTFSGTSGSMFDATTTTGLTLSAASSTFLFTNTTPNGSRSLILGGQTFGTFTVSPAAANGNALKIATSGTVGTFNLANSYGALQIASVATLTITNAINWVGTSTFPLLINSINSAAGTISLTAGGTISWAAFNFITFTGTAPTITNSFDLGSNSGATISPPSGGGGGGHIIGG